MIAVIKSSTQLINSKIYLFETLFYFKEPYKNNKTENNHTIGEIRLNQNSALKKNPPLDSETRAGNTLPSRSKKKSFINKARLFH